MDGLQSACDISHNFQAVVAGSTLLREIMLDVMAQAIENDERGLRVQSGIKHSNYIPATQARFERSRDIARMQLTPRDHEILEEIGLHRFLRSSQVVSLVAGSSQQVLRRLQLLFHHGYLDRPWTQLDYFHRSGSRPLVYGIG